MPQGNRLAFDLVSASGAGCGFGAFSAAFAVDSSGSEVSVFRDSTGSGQLNVSSDLDPQDNTVSALSMSLSGVMTASR